jgi:precorrin-4/cobalt-precorrin-4 C11-methyltransferase
MTQVYFIGAGPGDPELLTVKARKIIEKADVIVYADSLINPEICDLAKKGVEIYGSASMPLGEINSLMAAAVRQGKLVARLQSGDPAIFGAIQEQMAFLDAEKIEYEIIPGVSSLFASAAALKTELTIPELSQTVIVTRLEGKTPVPAAENLRSLAAHRATMAIFLSSSMVEQVVGELLAGGYMADTPAAVVYRASWKDQKMVRSSLNGLAQAAKEAGISRQALILVGDFLNSKSKSVPSKLYDASFKHGYR